MYDRERARKRYEKMKADGLCVACRRINPTPEHVICPDCNAKMRERNMKRLDYLRRIGFCISCGKNRAEKGKTRCRQCLQRGAKYSARWYKELHGNLAVDAKFSPNPVQKQKDGDLSTKTIKTGIRAN